MQKKEGEVWLGEDEQNALTGWTKLHDDQGRGEMFCLGYSLAFICCGLSGPCCHYANSLVNNQRQEKNRTWRMRVELDSGRVVHQHY